MSEAVQKMVRLYRRAVEKNDGPGVVAAYRGLWRHFQSPGAQEALCTAYVDWTGKAPLPPPSDQVIIRAPKLLPWTIALVSAPPWPSDLPGHAIPLSVIELGYLELCPKPLRDNLHKEMIRQWESSHIPQDVAQVLRWFDETQWEVHRIRSLQPDAASFSFEPLAPSSGSSAPSKKPTAGSAPAATAASSTKKATTGKSSGPATPSSGSVPPASSDPSGTKSKKLKGDLFDGAS